MINKQKDKEFIKYFSKYLLSKDYKFRYFCCFAFPLIGKETSKCKWDNDRKLYEFRIFLRNLLEVRKFEYFWVKVEDEYEMCIFMFTDWVFNDYFLRRVWYNKPPPAEGEEEDKEIKAYLRILMIKLDPDRYTYRKYINYLFDLEYDGGGISLKLFMEFKKNLDKL
jgi:hypothetical protein